METPGKPGDTVREFDDLAFERRAQRAQAVAGWPQQCAALEARLTAIEARLPGYAGPPVKPPVKAPK